MSYADYWAGFVCGGFAVWFIPRLDAWLVRKAEALSTGRADDDQ